MNTPSSGPFESREQLEEALRQQDATPTEIAEWLPIVQGLTEWPRRSVTAADNHRLLAVLAAAIPPPSPVRAAIRARYARQRGALDSLLDTARVQVSLFGLAFWLVSALITLVGGAVVLRGALPDQGLLLRASGPLLAYLGTTIAFRGTGAHTLECELVCPPSPVLLALARLVIVLGYDVGLGLALSLALWAGGAEQVLALMLAWFMPLLLVAGLALLLSLRLSVQTAASLAYGGWLAVLAINAISNFQVLPPTTLSDTLLGGVGMALLTVALLRLPVSMHRLLPSP